MKRTTPPKKRRTGKPRRGPARDAKYLAWIRTQPCIVCIGVDGPSEAAHIGPHGMAQKASDYDTLPICAVHHRELQASLHKMGRRFWDTFDLNREELIAEHQIRGLQMAAGL